jgi:hypothetical protein
MARKSKKTQPVDYDNDKMGKETFVVVKRSRIIIINYYSAPDLT